MLSLTVQDSATKDQNLDCDNDPSFNPQRINFNITPANTTLNIQRGLPMLESIENQDIFSWKYELIESSKIANWDDATLMSVIRATSSTKIQELFENCNSSADMIERVFLHKYSEGKALRYLNILTTVKQNNFYTITQYYQTIMKLCDRLAICLKWDMNTRNFKIKEIFYNGLNQRTLLEMTRLRVYSIDYMFELIKTTEATMMEQLKTNKRYDNEKRDRDSKGHKNNKNEQAREKWCRFHKTNTHHDEECRAQQKKKESSHHKEKNINPNLMIVHEQSIIQDH
ncbi:hypothetical protein DMUE_2298 [Dictyocoela muelleri]|nr:hypothetical protein DMUE_2298 [Dictyocoela muelleri]